MESLNLIQTSGRVVTFPWGWMRWWLEGDDASALGCSAAEMLIGARQTAERHFHSDCSELLIVHSGYIELRLEGGCHALAPGERLLLAANTRHAVANVLDEPAHLILIYSAAERNYTVAP